MAFIYISTSTGANIHLHYCMGRLAEWGFAKKDAKDCSNCGMTKNEKNDCCKDEHKFLKNDSDQKYPEASLQQMQLLAIALPPSFFDWQPHYFSLYIGEHLMSHAPPEASTVAVYIRNCTFRI